MTAKLKYSYILILLSMVLFSSGCISNPSETTEEAETTRNITGIPDLDHIVSIILNGNADELQSLIEFSEMGCTYAEGLGGPPKCEASEAEGTPVEVLPFLGPEGHFIRKADIDTWEGLNVTGLFAAYEVSDKAYSDANYPAGDFALVFLDASSSETTITLQVKNGRIVRIDYRFGNPPTINQDDVANFLVMPPNLVP
jgi:hypothetical protein